MESCSLLNLAVMTTDRCAAEAGQTREIQKLKEEGLPLLIGQRFARAGFSTSLRIVAASSSSVVAEVMVWLADTAAAASDLAYLRTHQLGGSTLDTHLLTIVL